MAIKIRSWRASLSWTVKLLSGVDVQGYAFCEFQEIGLTDYVIQNLNGKQIGNKFLTVKRALQPGPVAF